MINGDPRTLPGATAVRAVGTPGSRVDRMRFVGEEVEHRRWRIEMLWNSRRGISLKGGILHVEAEERRDGWSAGGRGHDGLEAGGHRAIGGRSGRRGACRATTDEYHANHAHHSCEAPMRYHISKGRACYGVRRILND